MANHCGKGLCGTACRCGCLICAPPAWTIDAEKEELRTRLAAVTAERDAAIEEMQGHLLHDSSTIDRLTEDRLEAHRELTRVEAERDAAEGLLRRVLALNVLPSARDVAPSISQFARLGVDIESHLRGRTDR